MAIITATITHPCLQQSTQSEDAVGYRLAYI